MDFFPSLFSVSIILLFLCIGSLWCPCLILRLHRRFRQRPVKILKSSHCLHLRTSFSSASNGSVPRSRVSSWRMGSEEKPAPKVIRGELGYVLEDVPHLTDHLPNLPVSSFVFSFLCGKSWSKGVRSKLRPCIYSIAFHFVSWSVLGAWNSPGSRPSDFLPFFSSIRGLRR